MTNRRVRVFFLSPPALSLFFWIIISLFVPPIFSRYKLIHIRDEQMSPNIRYYFSDLNLDNQSEKISIDLNDKDRTQVIIGTNNKVLDQYNLKHHASGPEDVYTCDYDHDGVLECIVFTRNSDSIFLSVIDPFNKHSVVINTRFIDTWQKAPYSQNIPWIKPVSLVKNKKSEYSDLVFLISTGFSMRPRNVYIYSIKDDSLLKSPESSAVIQDCILADLNNDGNQEIVLSTDATGNFEKSAPFTDQYSWLMVLDNKLNFVFSPVRFAEYPSRMKVIPFKNGAQGNLIVFNEYFGSKAIKSYFYLFDFNGNKIAEKEVEPYDNNFASILTNLDTTKNTFYFVKNKSGDVEEINERFEICARHKLPGMDNGHPIKVTDINNDGSLEYLFMGEDRKSLIITQTDLANAISIPFYGASGYPVISTVLRNGQKPEFYVQFVGIGSFFEYYKNPLFSLKYLFYFTGYLIILSIVYLISRIAQYRENLKLKTEREIASLQMKAIKNQIDPHLTLNILNAIGSLYTSDKEKDKADFLFAKYAKLIRQTVINSDQIIISLSEEIDFVKNYLDLEQFRLKDLFNYQINIDKDVDSAMKIPRMLLHSFVENAVKHGIRNRAKGGLLSINIARIPGAVLIMIEDNGPGFESGGRSENDTGKGFLIINELIELYYKLEHSKISYTVEKILRVDNSVVGTRVQIKI